MKEDQEVKNKPTASVGARINDFRQIRSVNHKLRSVKNQTVNSRKGLARPMLSRKNNHRMDIAKSQNIQRHSLQKNRKNLVEASKPALETRPAPHPLTSKAEQKMAIKNKTMTKPPHRTAKEIKETAIEKALSRAETPKKAKNANPFKKHLKAFNLVTIGLTLFVVLGFLAYIYMPFFSVNIANAQAGIKATYPEYRPDGYSLDGPVSFSSGEVRIKFKANTGNGNFTIKQTKSSWDSSAVKNKVNQESKGEFMTNEEKGLTIFTYNGNAAWVNGGILYNITGDTLLSVEQILKIATSL